VKDQLGPELGNSPLKLGSIPLAGLGFGYCGSVVREGASPVFGKAGSYWWGGYASTDFWIDPQENLVAILATQLIPAGGQPTRIVFSSAVYKAIEKQADAPEVAATN
jgi:CubicO group peptidase (beta-lactamase class C family)